MFFIWHIIFFYLTGLKCVHLILIKKSQEISADLDQCQIT